MTEPKLQRFRSRCSLVQMGPRMKYSWIPMLCLPPKYLMEKTGGKKKTFVRVTEYVNCSYSPGTKVVVFLLIIYSILIIRRELDLRNHTVIGSVILTMRVLTLSMFT